MDTTWLAQYQGEILGIFVMSWRSSLCTFSVTALLYWMLHYIWLHYNSLLPKCMGFLVHCKVWYRHQHSACVIVSLSLQWRHNGHDCISNHQPHHSLLNHLFGCRSKKTSKTRVTGLCVGNSPGTGEFPAQMASYAENVSIWWRHHVCDMMQLQRFCVCAQPIRDDVTM